jgi:dTMP kinase
VSALKGRFITIEGVDGAGKTTQTKLLAEKLGWHGVDTFATREPGGTPNADKIRETILSMEEASPDTMLCLFTAARADHARKLIQPLLERGTWVVCDRFLYSTYAYQGTLGGIPHNLITRLHYDFVNLEPDLTILLEVDPTQIRGRKQLGNDPFEGKGLAYQQEITRAYNLLSKMLRKNTVVVDGLHDQQTVHLAVWKHIEERFLT